MAWIQQRGKTWWIGYSLGGKTTRRSLKTEDKGTASRELEKYKTLESAKASGAALEPLFESLTGKSLPKVTLVEEIESWLREVERTTGGSTHARYSAAAKELIGFLKADASGPLLRDVTTADLRKHFDKRFDNTSAATANLERKILRVFFRRESTGDEAVIKINPLTPIKQYVSKTRKKPKKLLKIEQVAELYSGASEFWQYMMIGGLYTALRLGDLITLEIDDVNFDERVIVRGMRKLRGKIVQIPLVDSLASAIKQQIGNRTSGPIWPEQAKRYEAKGSSPFSNEFYDLMARHGIVPNRTHAKKKKGRRGPHEKSEFSFHTFRHMAVSLLKKGGANVAVAKEFAGHSSDAMSDHYTHTSIEEKRAAIEKLPQFTK